MLTLARSNANGSSILFKNSAGNLGKLGFTSNGVFHLGNGASTDGVGNLLQITSIGNITAYGNIKASGKTITAKTFSGNATTATTASKLGTNAGSGDQPVYFSNGVPVAATAYANASVNYATSAGTATSATDATNTTNINTLADNSSNAARFILFSNAATGNQRVKTDSGLKYNPSSNTITATLAGNASSATKVNNKLTLKFDSGTAENTSLYTYDGSAAKTIDIKAGSNVSMTKAANSITIKAVNTVYTHPTSDGNKHVPTTGTTNNGKVLKAGETAGFIY